LPPLRTGGLKSERQLFLPPKTESVWAVGFLDALGGGSGQSILFRKAPMRPQCGVITAAKIVELGEKSIAQFGRWLGSKHCLGRRTKLSVTANDRSWCRIVLAAVQPTIPVSPRLLRF